MALIKCPECGKDVSDTCACCIHCGYSLYSPVASFPSAAPEVHSERQNKHNVVSWVRNHKKLAIAAVSIAVLLLVIILIVTLSAAKDPFEKMYVGQPRESVHRALGEQDTRGRSSDSDVYTSDIYYDVKFLGKTCDLVVTYDDTVTNVVSACLSTTDYTNDADSWDFFYDILEFYTKKYGNPEYIKKIHSYEASYVWHLESGDSIQLIKFKITGSVIVILS